MISLRNSLIQLYEVLRPKLIDLEVSTNQIAYRRDKIDKATEFELELCINWLEAMIEVRLKKITEAIELVPLEQWENYKLIGVEGLKEQQIRLRAEREFLVEWSYRPDLLRKKVTKNAIKGKGKAKRLGKSKSTRSNKNLSKTES